MAAGESWRPFSFTLTKRNHHKSVTWAAPGWDRALRSHVGPGVPLRLQRAPRATDRAQPRLVPGGSNSMNHATSLPAVLLRSKKPPSPLPEKSLADHETQRGSQGAALWVERKGVQKSAALPSRRLECAMTTDGPHSYHRPPGLGSVLTWLSSRDCARRAQASARASGAGLRVRGIN